MEKPARKALLDTDFIFKTHLAVNRNHNNLAQLVLDFRNYEFFCHEKVLSELSFHSFSPDPVPWLKDRIDKGFIRCYSDVEIMDELENLFGLSASRLYFDLLRTSCDSFSPFFFNDCYSPLFELPDNTDRTTFLKILGNCEENIPNGNSMGEKKTFVLAGMLQIKYPGQVTVFCSDDGRARRSAIYIDERMRCLSIPAVFQKLRKEGLEKSEAREYYDSLCAFYSLHGQKTVKVWRHERPEKVSVDFDRLFEEIYSDMFETLATGDLRYKGNIEALP